MEDYNTLRQQMQQEGFAIVNDIFNDESIASIIQIIENASTGRNTFRKSKDLFAIRQFLKEIPQLQNLIFTNALLTLIRQVFGSNYFVVKSIYFDKPPASNWFVSCHQDLTISVKEGADVLGFGPWTVKQDQYAVQPPLNILENNFTVRIHLDNTDENNGALKVIPGSHTQGIVRPETVENKEEKEINCNVKRGGVMLMRPLLLHASGRTTTNERRRVIHIEFSNQNLPQPPEWSEYLAIH